MVRTNLLNLPSELLEKILVNICNDDISALCAARMSCKALNNAGKTPSFYKEVDLLSIVMPDHNNADEGVAAFKELCFTNGNLSAIYLRGISEYFRDKQEEGLEKIKRAAREGYLLAQYTTELIHLILTVDTAGRLTYHPTISRKDCYRMRNLIRDLDFQQFDYDLPQQLMDNHNLVLLDDEWCYECARHDQWVYWWYNTSDTSFLCHTDFWKLEIRRFVGFMCDFAKPWQQ